MIGDTLFFYKFTQILRNNYIIDKKFHQTNIATTIPDSMRVRLPTAYVTV